MTPPPPPSPPLFKSIPVLPTPPFYGKNLNTAPPPTPFFENFENSTSPTQKKKKKGGWGSNYAVYNQPWKYNQNVSKVQTKYNFFDTSCENSALKTFINLLNFQVFLTKRNKLLEVLLLTFVEDILSRVMSR